ncbi:SCO family protein [Pseudomaricurvus alkylphenolicus]|uniref:SCO family protein n=1 Tax=Pseudomaricurvus alkylphenolicus TaxID=1306991 RepID=UPI001422D442|nr:SCO family protein [Pseudomaricurvus alkylphenolicus]NIB39530.1 SCO family protein [Pseudomaricurvus alkylphenolicus]
MTTTDTLEPPFAAPPHDKTPQQRKGIYLTLLAIGVFVTLVMAGFLNKITTPRVLSPIELRANGTYVFDQPRIFKDFSLQNQHGESFALEQLKGKWSLMFFGFTSCPDVCPATLSLMKDVKAQLKPEIAAKTQFVLVSVDPARDTSEQLNQYMAYFDPEFVGLTGEFLEIKRLANQLNMAFVKVRQGPGAMDYTVDHSTNIALVNPFGHYHGFIKPPLDTARVKLTLQSIVTTFDP